ncbi:hypothetical protein DL96DRAFT_1609560 [Flagelloscypha sp. PMI_526]|nr:hypothetical protein DL96DRAFT_1609560 [Flagelloscypha sp. PMI_526]
MSKKSSTAKSVSSSPVHTLQFVWPGVDGSESQYAMTPLPGTYEDAIRVAIRVFSEQIVTTKPENFTLKLLTRDHEGDFVWATIEPVNWQSFVTGERPIAVYEAPSEESFIHGPVHLILGRRLNGKTLWKTPENWNRQDPVPIENLTEVDRPTSYEDAVVVVKSSGTWFANDNSDEAKTLDISNRRFQFVKFHTDKLQSWSKFPERAYSDAKVWRQVIPVPGGLLGALLLEE